MEKKRKRFTYKLAHIDGNKFTLQQLLGASMAKRPCAVNRFQMIGVAQDVAHFINQSTTVSQALCGTFCAFTSGRHQTVLDMDATATAFTVEAIPAPPGISGKKVRREFVDGTLYYCVFGNHVCMLQSAALRVQTFENYLNWFMEQAIPGRIGPWSIKLTDQLHPEKYSKVKRIKKIRISDNLAVTAETTNGKEVVSLDRENPAWKALCAFLKDINPILPSDLRVEEIIKAPQIKATLELAWKDRLPGDHTPLLDRIGTTLRHVEDELDYVIALAGGGTLTKQDFKLSSETDIETVNGNPHESSVFKRLREWLDILIGDGRILPS